MTPAVNDEFAGGGLPADAVPAPIQDFIRHGKWELAVSELQRLDVERALGARALEYLALASYMTGRDAGFADATARAHDKWVEAGSLPDAARCAFWIGLTSIFRGEAGKGSGWLSRAAGLLAKHPGECVEAGYLLLPRSEIHLDEGRPDLALAVASDAVEIAERFADSDLTSLAQHLVGRARLTMGEFSQGLAVLDEAMVSAIEGRLSPIVTGLLYCSVIDVCQAYQILDRAREWTEALADWCRRQPQLVAFTGRCLVHRSEILMFEGRWSEAVAEAGQACERFADGASASRAGQAHYYMGEAHRLQGKIELAEAAFRKAAALGFDPQPGLALLRLRQGRTREAQAGIRRALAAAGDDSLQIGLLSAAAEVFLAAGDLGESRDCGRRLSRLANDTLNAAARAAAAEVTGALALGADEHAVALAEFARSVEIWRGLNSPYRIAAVRLKTARACAAMLDMEAAQAEARAARDAFAKLGAEPDRLAAETLLRQLGAAGRRLLTARQIEVLELVALGRTNREIAERLAVSERTVDRHVSDILTRMNVPTRAAAAAFAVANGLIAAGLSG